MLTIKENTYELKYTEKRLDQIEALMDKSLFAELNKTRGMLRMLDLKIVLGSGLTNSETGNHIPPKQGIELAGEFIQENGYAEAINQMSEAINRDLPFLFAEE